MWLRVRFAWPIWPIFSAVSVFLAISLKSAYFKQALGGERRLMEARCCWAAARCFNYSCGVLQLRKSVMSGPFQRSLELRMGEVLCCLRPDMKLLSALLQR